MGVTQDQEAPCITGNGQATRNGAGFMIAIFVVHTILIVTCL